jgi:uncharacterized protein (DUF697 family)
MSRKKLPKAIMRATRDLSGIGTDADEQHKTWQPQRAASKTSPHGQLSAPQSAASLVAAKAEAAILIHPKSQAGRRRAVAEKIVARYKLYAGMGGLSPLPIMTATGVSAVILQMVKTLSNLYEVPFERDLTRSIIVGLMGGAVPTGLGVATASALALALPGVGFVGVAVSALAAAALTGRIGLVFVERFESGHMTRAAWQPQK